jgi:excisionase family DNA binding protein
MKPISEMNRNRSEPVTRRAAWSLAEIAKQTGLSLGFLRNEVRAARLPIRKFGRRVLVLDEDLRAYLVHGSERKAQ